MKRNVLVILCLLAVINLYSQLGFHIGFSGTESSTWILKQDNYSTLTPFVDSVIRSSDMKYKYIYGWNAGVVLGYNFTPNWGIQAEVQYNYTGQSYDDNYTGPAVLNSDTIGSIHTSVNVTRDVRLHYVQVPLMVKFITTKGDRAKFFACLGPQFGFRTYAYEQIKIAGMAYIPPDSLTANQKFRSFDLGLALQAGTDIFIIPNFYVEAGLSGYIGLTDLNGAALQDIGWYSKNNNTYRSSHNFRGGLMLGFHYIFVKKEETQAATDP